MPIKHSIWKIGTPPERLLPSKLAREELLESMIAHDVTILSDDWMIVGRQVATKHGPIDLLCITPDGTLVIVELKREKTPRDVVAQALDYAACVGKFSPEEVAAIYARFSNGKNFAEAFRQRFGHPLDDDALHGQHEIVIVASEVDARTETIVKYLSERDLPINVLFFQVFENGAGQLLSRAWLIDPTETQLHTVAAPRSDDEPWNGEFYVCFGDGPERSWEEARRYGFISAGGGSWYTRTLNVLKPGDRVWVNIPGRGYVGVGSVTGTAVPATEFRVDSNGSLAPALDALQGGHYHRSFADDPERAEYFVPVKWLDTTDGAPYTETGLFGNQNTVCKPTSSKWRHTVERLKARFPRWNDSAQ